MVIILNINILGNLIKNPEEEKFQKINLDNKAYKKRVGNVLGGKVLLEAIGFVEKDGFLVMENYNKQKVEEYAELIRNALISLS